MKKTIGILAHVDAGKTTFAEGILFHGNAIEKMGRVDHKNSFLDNHSIEQERGITIFSEQASFSYKNSEYYLIDTPGHADFCAEMERSIEVMDSAVLIISGVDGVQGHTKTVWKLLRQYHIPTFLFINKMDREQADVVQVMEELKHKLSENIVYVEYKDTQRNMSESFAEWVAEREEELLFHYFEHGYDKKLWQTAFGKMIYFETAFPCMSGSALFNQGMTEFLEELNTYTKEEIEEEEKTEEFAGRVYKIRHDENRNKITFIKVLSGCLHVKDEISYGFDEYKEKVNQIRFYNGKKYESKDYAEKGDIVALTGLSNTKAGDGLGKEKSQIPLTVVSTLCARVIFPKEISTKAVVEHFKIFEAEGMISYCYWEEEIKELHIHIMGVIQLEVLKELVKERYHYEVEFQDPKVLYKETIKKTVKGYGHFEPLRHYAETAIELTPAERNSGIQFESKCHVDKLALNYQNLIKTHIFEKEHKGILTGAPLTDVTITLLMGISHIKHTEGGDFREATYRAIRQGLEKAENILLEPYYSFEIEVEHSLTGKVISDIKKLSGSFSNQTMIGETTLIYGRGPVSEFMNYNRELIGYSKGKGRISFQFDGYDICHNTKEVIQRINYQKEKDINNTSSSVFCAKGTSFVVKWDEAENYMHCLS